MASEPTQRVSSNQELALEIVKAALAGGALNHAALTVQAESAAKQAVAKAAVDSAYITRLFQSTLDRLNQLK